jgi:hypothetical protein
LPGRVRGYGHIKLANMDKVAQETRVLKSRAQHGQVMFMDKRA